MTEQIAYAEMLAAEQSATLDDILSRWHWWQGGYRDVRGHGNKALVAGEFRVSKQYDAQNGAQDDEIEGQVMKQVDFEVTQMGEPYRAAIYVQARALNLGLAVFTSPRLPQDLKERAFVIQQARRILTARLVSAGVM
jgi:hypothetical protein